MDRFEYTTSKLETGERSVIRMNGVKLYDGDIKTTFEGGELLLTTHRLLWGHSGDISRGLTCLSLPLQCVIFVEEEQTSSFFSKSKKIILYLSEPLKGKNLGPVAYSPNNFIKLSFKDDSTNLIKFLNDTITAKVWAPSVSSPSYPSVNSQPGINNTAAPHEKQGDITEDETVKFKSYLLSLGIDDPVTRNSFNNQNEFYQSLARQISDMMKDPIAEVGGIMSLADVYCRVNRARGLELLSPEDLLAACQSLNHLKLPVQLRQFDSGVKVLQIEAHTDKAIISSTSEMVKEKGSFTAEQLAQELGLSVILAKERLLTSEKYGYLCRDESIEGLRFYPNLFLDK